MSQRVVVAIDGPSGSGKSSVSRQVASRLGLAYLDTGAMYRAITWSCLAGGVELDDVAAITGWSSEVGLTVSTDPATAQVVVQHPLTGAHDVTEAVREPQISANVSAIATNLDVRALLIGWQRDLIDAAEHGIVVEGRDITTVVAPDADARVLLTASEAARLGRRATQDSAGGVEQSADDLHDQVLRRDATDATVASFHTAADGVHVIDSTHLDFEQTVQAVIDLVERALAEKATP